MKKRICPSPYSDVSKYMARRWLEKVVCQCFSFWLEKVSFFFVVFIYFFLVNFFCL